MKKIIKNIIVNLITEKKHRLICVNASSLQTDNEYQEAYYTGIAEEIENSIWDLEDILKAIEQDTEAEEFLEQKEINE